MDDNDNTGIMSIFQFQSNSNRTERLFSLEKRQIKCRTLASYNDRILLEIIFLIIDPIFRHGIASPIIPEVERRTAEVVNDIGLSKKYRAYLKFFYVQGFDLFHMGSFKTRYGAYVGLPGTFNYKTKADIERNLIVVCLPANIDVRRSRKPQVF
jgi:hypothetical protein